MSINYTRLQGTYIAQSGNLYIQTTFRNSQDFFLKKNQYVVVWDTVKNVENNNGDDVC